MSHRLRCASEYGTLRLLRPRVRQHGTPSSLGEFRDMKTPRAGHQTQLGKREVNSYFQTHACSPRIMVAQNRGVTRLTPYPISKPWCSSSTLDHDISTAQAAMRVERSTDLDTGTDYRPCSPRTWKKYQADDDSCEAGGRSKFEVHTCTIRNREEGWYVACLAGYQVFLPIA